MPLPVLGNENPTTGLGQQNPQNGIHEVVNPFPLLLPMGVISTFETYHMEIPCNYFFCVPCKGFWGRIQLPYVSIQKRLNGLWKQHFSGHTTNVINICNQCGGTTLKHEGPIKGGCGRLHWEYLGKQSDAESGQIIYVGSRRQRFPRKKGKQHG